ncbi:MAG: AI-2E family transporter [Planctomycetota bacterium]|nr:MAG: AI-2E family transporter [Planctomycetota bacterium]
MQIWTSRTRRILFFTISIIVVFIVGYWLSPVLNPFLIALGIAYILNPIVSFFERRRVPRLVTTIGLFFVFIGALALVLMFTIPTLVKQISNTPVALFGGEYSTWIDTDGNQKPDESEYNDWNDNGKCDGGYIDRLRWWIEQKTGKDPAQQWDYIKKELASSETRKEIQNSLGGIASGIQDYVISFISSLFNIITILLLIPIYTFFLMLEMDNITAGIKRYIPAAYKERILDIMGRINEAVSGFFRGRLIICIIIGAVTWLGLFICGVRFSGLIAVATGVSILVPLLWIPLGLGPALLLAYMDTGITWPFFCVFIIFGAIQVLEAILQPLIIGKYAGLHPITLILSMFLFGYVFGTFGVLLAVPLMCIVKILFREFIVPVLKQYAEEEVTGPEEKEEKKKRGKKEKKKRGKEEKEKKGKEEKKKKK